ncbi:carboxypeptidase regulatory-like domain-containing protein [Candidatus Uhrbacteria bacterium]|nr:carboxypeptidase regulatory-like domain-containing protein [Candidatus Uhrbacteria bacterium]
MGIHFIVFLKRIVVSLLIAALFVFHSGITVAAIASPATDTLSRLQVGVTADHEIVFLSPTGINANTDTITIDLSAFTFGAVDASDVLLGWGATTGFEQSTSVAAVPGVGIWGASFGGGFLTLTAPSDASGPSGIAGGQKIGIKIGLNAGGTHQLTNPVTPSLALIAIGGTFGDSNTIAVPIVSSDMVTVSATVAATTTTSTPPCTGCGGGGGGSVFPPVISNVQATMITTSTALITWTTDQSTDSTVFFGQTISYSSGTIMNGAQVNSHAIQITGLIPDELYHFQVSSLNGLTLLQAVSGDFTFTTLAENVPLVITNLQVLNITDTTALVSWNTNKPASSLVHFGLTNSYGLSASTAGLVTSHVVSLSGLTPATLYHFEVVSIDGSNVTATSPDGTFTTLSDITPPANVINLSVTPGDTVNNLNWTLPPDPDFAGTKILRKLGGYPTNPFDGVTVYDGSGVTVLDTGLTNGTTYYYTAYAYDTTNNFSSGALGVGTPIGLIVVPPTSTPPIPPTSTPPIPPTSTSTPPVNPIPVSPTSTLPSPPLPSTAGITVQYYGSGGSLLLTPDMSGRIGVLAGSPTRVVLPVMGMSTIPTSVTAVIGGNVYAMTYIPSESVFAATFVIPNPGEVPSRVTALFQDGSQRQISHTLFVQPTGQVVESSLIGETDRPVPGAEVVLFHEIGGTWVRYNTSIAGGSGQFAFVVPNGRYYVEVEAQGFDKRVSNPVYISYNVFNESQSLIFRTVEIPKIDTEKPLIPQVVEIGNVVTQNASTAVQRFTQNSVTQEVVETSAPIITALALVNTASALSLFNFLAYLQYLFTQPLLLLFPGRRKKWGIVYHSLTKKPVDLAIVRLMQFETKLVVQTKITNKEGQYSFDVKKGNYLIEVVKPGYVFPSDFLKDSKEDMDFVDLYFGTKIEIADQNAIISLNIPVDPIAREETPQKILWRKALRKLKYGLAFTGVLAGMVIVLIQPTFIHGLLLCGQIAAYLLFRRIATPVRSNKWGSVIDAKTKKPIHNAVVRIFDKKFNKLLETQITDRNGSYGFFVGRNVYYVTAQKVGYKRYVSPDLDLRKKESAIVDHYIHLETD